MLLHVYSRVYSNVLFSIFGNSYGAGGTVCLLLENFHIRKKILHTGDHPYHHTCAWRPYMDCSTH